MFQNISVNFKARILVLTVFLLFLSSGLQAAEPIPLRAGPLTMVFEPDNAFLRYVNLGHHEVLRGINAPIRNQYWGTVQPEVTNVKLDNHDNHFSLEFDVNCYERDVNFFWHGTIRGSAEGKVELIFDGEARSDFKRNRIGFCVLHGPSAAGQPWAVENPKGEKTEGVFPAFISPHQPAKDISAITHQVTDNIWARVEFEGDVWETEDQRNWTDASFKTYCTPLAIPYPVQVTKGDKVYQRIVIALEGELDSRGYDGQAVDGQVLMTLGKKKFPMPRLGLQVSKEVEDLSETQIQRLQALNLNHLRADLAPANKDFASKLRQATSQAKSLNLTLQAGLHLGENPADELRTLTTELEKVQPPISVWLVNEADKELFRLARKHLKPHSGEALIGSSQDTNFVELNRARPTDEQIEVVSYGVNPQIHAIDNASIIETLPIQGDTVRSAKQFIGDRKLIVGPITFKPQPLAQKPAPDELPANVDIRQPSLFVAGWTLGSVKYLAEASTESATYFETVGWRGIMEAGEISPQRAKFPSQPSQVFSCYHVLRNLADFADGEVIEFDTSDALSVVGIALTDGKKIRLLIANLTSQEKSVSIRGLGEEASSWALNSNNSTEANSRPESFHLRSGIPWPQDKPVILSPFEIIRIEWTMKK